VDAAADVVAGIVAGLDELRERGTLVAFAGGDAPAELAAGVVSAATRLGVGIAADSREQHWPLWTELA
jgi:hypothetical protein